MKKFTPFTSTDYPKGYSRNDAIAQLTTVVIQIANTKTLLKKLEKEEKQLHRDIKRGGFDA
jgi:hypothetical protein